MSCLNHTLFYAYCSLPLCFVTTFHLYFIPALLIDHLERLIYSINSTFVINTLRCSMHLSPHLSFTNCSSPLLSCSMSRLCCRLPGMESTCTEHKFLRKDYFQGE